MILRILLLELRTIIHGNLDLGHPCDCRYLFHGLPMHGKRLVCRKPPGIKPDTGRIPMLGKKPVFPRIESYPSAYGIRIGIAVKPYPVGIIDLHLEPVQVRKLFSLIS